MLSRLVAKNVVIAPPSASSVSNVGIFIFWSAVKTYHLVELKWPYILSFNIGKGVMWGFSFVFDDKNARQGKASNDSRTKVEKVISKTWGKAVIKTWHFSLINKKKCWHVNLGNLRGNIATTGAWIFPLGSVVQWQGKRLKIEIIVLTPSF